MRIRFLLVFLLAFACSAQGQGPVYKLLYLGSVASIPINIFEAQPGLFYGLSISGNGGPAAIFSLTSGGMFKTIYTFATGNNYNVLSLAQNTNGKLYGAGFYDSGNFYFSVSPDGSDFQQYPFPGTWGPFGETLVAPPGELYDLAGALTKNGASETYGLVRIDESGQATILHQFSAGEGVPDPYSSIVYALDGNIYGLGLQAKNGISPAFIYRFTPSGAYSQLLNFGPFSGSFNNPLVAGAEGTLYGSFEGHANQQGPKSTGVIYQATLSGEAQVLATFPPKGLVQPVSLMQAADGNLYGSTNIKVNDYIFRYDFVLNKLSPLYDIPFACSCRLIEGMDGKLYGVGQGSYTIFSLDIGLPKPAPVISGLYPASGPVGQKVILWGNYLLGPTSVTFDSVPAQDAVATSIRSVAVSVPAGATTGPVTITTANGTFTTTQNFTVE